MTAVHPFVELEFVHAIGPGAGRYVVAGPDGAPDDVLQIVVTSAGTTAKGLRRRSHDATAADAPAPVPVLRVMWIGAGQGVEDVAVAERRLARLRSEEPEREALIAAVLDVLNDAIRAHRAAARDPYVTEVTRADPRVVRYGYGEPRELTHSRWTAASTAPAPRAAKVDRAVRLGPSETVALVLRGRLDLLQSEELVLRGLLDLDRRRWTTAALQLVAAAQLLGAELRAASGSTPAPGDELDAHERQAAALAQRALAGTLDAGDHGALETLAADLAGVLERWRAPVEPRAGVTA